MDIGLSMFAHRPLDPTGRAGAGGRSPGLQLALLPRAHPHPHQPAVAWANGPVLPEEYKRTHDPFVALATAAALTERIRIGTSVCLVAERDPIVTAKQVASLDMMSGGRFMFGIGVGWNEEEMEDHGVDPAGAARSADKVLAMKALWTEEEAEFWVSSSLRAELVVAQARPAAAPADLPRRRRWPHHLPPRDRVLRRLVPVRLPRPHRGQGGRAPAAVGGGRPRPRHDPDQELRPPVRARAAGRARRPRGGGGGPRAIPSAGADVAARSTATPSRRAPSGGSAQDRLREWPRRSPGGHPAHQRPLLDWQLLLGARRVPGRAGAVDPP